MCWKLHFVIVHVSFIVFAWLSVKLVCYFIFKFAEIAVNLKQIVKFFTFPLI